MCPLLRAWAGEFGEAVPPVTLEAECLGSEHGLDALRDGRADLAFVTWLPEELPTWGATAVARDGLCVIVNSENPIEGLGMLQLEALFRGQVNEWRALNPAGADEPVRLVSREAGSGIRAAFEALVMQGHPVSSLAVVLSSGPVVADYVANHPEAVGYVAKEELVPDCKCLAVEGTFPTAETVASGSYPLSHLLWLVYPEPVPPAVATFVEFALGPDGQRIAGLSYGRVR